MGETFFQITLHLLFGALIFRGIIALRNKIEYDNSYGTYKARDGLLLMLVFYVLFFFREAELGHLNLYLHYDLPGGSYGLSYWIPFSWIQDKLEYLTFLDYVGANYWEQSSFLTTGLPLHYLKFFFHLLPMSLLYYLINSEKWLGLVLAELTTLLCFLFGYSFFIGDGLFFVGVTYALIHGLSVLMRQKSRVKNLRRVYAVAGLVLAVSSVLVMEVGYYDRDDDKVVESLELDESFAFYDDRVNLELTRIELVTSSLNKNSLRFNGKVTLDRDLYELGDIRFDDVSVSYSYEYYGLPHGSSTGTLDYTLRNREPSSYPFRQAYLDLYRSGSNYDIENRIEDMSKPFLVFEGIDELRFQVAERDIGKVVEILDGQLGFDNYPYYEFTYKTLKIEGQAFEVYAYPFGEIGQDDYVSFYTLEPEIVEETDNYMVSKKRAYIRDKDLGDEVLDSIEPRLYGVYMRVPIEVDEPIFVLEEESLYD